VNPISAVSNRIKESHPDHREIFKGMAWVSLFVVLAKLAGAAKEMAVAYRYGVSAEVDAYLFVFNFVNWPVGVWFAVLTVVLVPLSARIARDAPGEFPLFRAELFGHALLWGAALAVITGAGLYIMLYSPWSGLSPHTVSIAIGMAPAQALLAPLGILVSLFSAWTLAAGRHANSLLEGVPALVIITALVTLPAGGIEVLVWATVLGFLAHMLALGIPLARRAEIEAPRFTLASPYWRAFWQGFGILLAGQALMTLIGFIDLFFAARLGTGAVSVLGYANRILALLLGLGAMVASRAMLPVFSRAEAQVSAQRWRIVSGWARVLFLAGIAATLIGWQIAPWAVKILFERGAFTAHNSQGVTEVLRYGLTQLPFYFGGLVLVTYASSRRCYKLLFWPGVIGIAAKVGANLVLIPLLGVNGIAAGWACVYGLTALFFWVTLRRLK
jgi:peptidoglycan biosynthesis protein MviN/MurJ (putative lipid II flippase)